MKRILFRVLTPALTLLLGMLAMVAGVSMSKTQKKAEAYACNSSCGGFNCFGMCTNCGGVICVKS